MAKKSKVKGPPYKVPSDRFFIVVDHPWGMNPGHGRSQGCAQNVGGWLQCILQDFDVTFTVYTRTTVSIHWYSQLSFSCSPSRRRTRSSSSFLLRKTWPVFWEPTNGLISWNLLLPSHRIKFRTSSNITLGITGILGKVRLSFPVALALDRAFSFARELDALVHQFRCSSRVSRQESSPITCVDLKKFRISKSIRTGDQKASRTSTAWGGGSPHHTWNSSASTFRAPSTSWARGTYYSKFIIANDSLRINPDDHDAMFTVDIRIYGICTSEPPPSTYYIPRKYPGPKGSWECHLRG